MKEDAFLAQMAARSDWVGEPFVVAADRGGGLPDIKRLPLVKTIGRSPVAGMQDYSVFRAGEPDEFVVRLPTNREPTETTSAVKDAATQRLANLPPAGLIKYRIVEHDEDAQYVVLDAFFERDDGTVERANYLLSKNDGDGWTEGKIV